MAKARLGFAAGTDVAQFAFQTLHFEPHGGAAEEGEGDDARRGVGLGKTDRQQVERFGRIAIAKTFITRSNRSTAPTRSCRPSSAALQS